MKTLISGQFIFAVTVLWGSIGLASDPVFNGVAPQTSPTANSHEPLAGQGPQVPAPGLPSTRPAAVQIAVPPERPMVTSSPDGKGSAESTASPAKQPLVIVPDGSQKGGRVASCATSGESCAPDLKACGVSNASDCGGCCGSGWIFNADVMFLRRSSPSPIPLVNDQITGAEALNASALGFNHQAFPYFQLIRTRTCRCNPCQDCCLDWDIGYFGIQSWGATAVANPPNSPVLLAPGVDLPSSAPGNQFRFSNGTDLQSAEFNLRRQVTECLTVIAGYRWLDLSDTLWVDEVGNAQGAIYRIDTNNRLHGFQIGANSQLWNCGGAFHIDGIVRAGVFYNRADQDTDAPALAPFAPVFVDHVGARGDHTAFLGELGLQGQYHLNRHWSVRGGYRLMWLEGVALAPDQIPVSDLVAPGFADVATGGSLFFHGALVGLQAQW